MKVTLNHYQLYLDEEEGRTKYEEIKNICTELGHKLFECIPLHQSEQDMPETQTIDPSHLFLNQYNTIEGFRIFDWYERINPHNRKFKAGYYLTGDIEELKARKAAQHICGYCGKRYEPPIKQLTCDACLGSEYLKEKDLPLLILKPVAEGLHAERRLSKEEQEDLEVARRDALEIANAARKVLRLERMKKEAKDLLLQVEHENKQRMQEAQIKAALLNAGFETGNLIYYSHTNSWCYGWRESVDYETECAVMKELRALPCELPFEFFQNLTFKNR